MALAVAQATGSTSSGLASVTVSFGSSTTSGSLIVGIGCYYNTGGVVGAAGDCTDSKSNTYSLAGYSFGAVNQAGIGGYYNNAGTRGSSHSVTVNLVNAAGESDQLGIIEITGQDPSTPFDSTTFATANDITSSFDVTAAAAISGNQIAIYGVSVAGTSGSPSWTGPTGYTVAGSQNNADTSLVYWTGYKINETGTPTVGGSWSGTVGESPREIFMSFKEAGGGAPAVDYSGPPTDPVDPLGWMVTTQLQNVPISPDTTPYSADQPVSTADVSVAGWLPAAVHPIGGATADRNLAGILYSTAIPFAPASHDISIAGIVHVGAPAYGPASHDANVAGVLYSGPFVLTSGGFDYITTGVLYATAVPMATVSHTANVAGILYSTATPYGPVSHAANVAGILELGVTPYGPISHTASVAGILYSTAIAYTGPSFDQSTIGVLFAGAYSPATITTSRTVTGIVPAGPIQLSTVTATRSVAGWLPVAPGHVAVVTHTTSTLGLVVVGVVPYATFGPVAPLSPVTDTLYLAKPWEAVTLERTGTLWLRTSSTVDAGKATDTPWRRTHQGQVIE